MSSRPPVRASASRKVTKPATPITSPKAASVAPSLADPIERPAPSVSSTSKASGVPAVVTPMGWMHTARFLTTAAQLHHLPEMDTPEIAFVGRSNAGKSTCINTLTQKKQLAFASKKPGRTQHINLFALGKQGVTDAVLADLPGYGYAAVAKMDKLRWQQVMANYLVSRENLTGIVMMCDPRHGLTELDDILLEVIRPRVEEGLKFLIILTKADKLTRAEQAKALSIARLQAGGGEVKLFSALKKQGVDEVAQLLWDWTHPAAGALLATPTAQTSEEEPEALDE
jgi:GTP-binding protein